MIDSALPLYDNYKAMLNEVAIPWKVVFLLNLLKRNAGFFFSICLEEMQDFWPYAAKSQTIYYHIIRQNLGLNKPLFKLLLSNY